jgi:hypothetical protein
VPGKELWIGSNQGGNGLNYINGGQIRKTKSQNKTVQHLKYRDRKFSVGILPHFVEPDGKQKAYEPIFRQWMRATTFKSINPANRSMTFGF